MTPRIDSDALLPCPFCGETLVPTQSGDGYAHNRRIRRANNCVLSWVVVCPPHDSAWNTRADSPELIALRKAGDKLSFAAQTSGGVAGRDEGLIEAIEEWAIAKAEGRT